MAVAARFHCLVQEWQDCEEVGPKPRFLSTKKGEAKTHRTERSAATRRCRCVRCGRNSRNTLKMPGKCVWDQGGWMDRDFNSKCSLGRAPHGEKNAPEW